MKIKFLQIKYFLSILLVSLGFIFLFYLNPAQAVLSCADKYPPGDGQCRPTCNTDEFEDKSTGLCDGGGLCCHKMGALPNIQLQIPLPAIPGGAAFTQARSIVDYIVHLYELSLYFLIPMAIFIIMLGGVKWILAAGNPSKIGKAKEYIFNSLLGLTIGILSYVILSVVGITKIDIPQLTYLGDEPTHSFAYWDPSSPTGWSDVPPVYNPPPGGGSDPSAPPGSGGPSKPGYPTGPGSNNCDSPTWESLGCPGSSTEIQVCFTNYYSPDDPTDGGLYKREDTPQRNFLCNVGMNCQCPRQGGLDDARDTGYSCKDKYSTKPCRPFTPYQPGFQPHVDYCIGARKPVVANSSVAIDTTYFNYFCKFEIVGRTGTYEARDTGGGIKGLHMDFYCGIGKTACKSVNAPKGPATIKISSLTDCYTPACRAKPWVPSSSPPAGTYTHEEALRKLTDAKITVTSSGTVTANCPCPGACRPCTKATVGSCSCSCTTLDQIPKVAIDNVIKIKNFVGETCNFRVTGGTEPCHQSHGPSMKSIDLSRDSCLVPALKDRATYQIRKIGTYRDSVYTDIRADFEDGTAANAHFHLSF